jgi:DNA-binding HxlR family transcriptional regulator
MPLGNGYAGQDCSLARALELVGERWTPLVLRDAFFGVRRYGDFRAHLDIPRAVLSDRLRTLVAAGVLAKEPYSESREEYVLTDIGRQLWPVLYSLSMWGERNLPAVDGPRRLFAHAACGTRLGPGGGCPACGTTPEPAELEIRPGPGADLRRTDPVSVALRRPHRMLTPLESHQPLTSQST